MRGNARHLDFQGADWAGEFGFPVGRCGATLATRIIFLLGGLEEEASRVEGEALSTCG
jgi:hypothetical protein